MIKMKRSAFLQIGFAILSCVFINSAFADLILNVGQTTTFTAFNFYYSGYQENPVQKNPPNGPYGVPDWTASASGNTAATSISASAGEAGMAGAAVGVQYTLNYDPANWAVVKDMPVVVTLNFAYTISANYTPGYGSADAYVTYNLYNTGGWPAFDLVGFQAGSPGVITKSITANYLTTYGMLNDTYGNNIRIIGLSSAHLESGSGTHTSSTLLTLNSITITPSAVPEPATMILLGSGLVGFIGFSRKFKK